MHTRRTLCLTISLIACVAASAVACTIPVFRFALEKWQPDAYMLYVAHRGELSAADKTLVEKLQQTVRDQNETLNLVVSVVDVSKQNEPVLDFLLEEQLKSIKSPQLVLVYPFNLSQTQPLPVVDSPRTADGPTAATPGQTPALPNLTTAPPGLTAVPPGLASCPTGTCNFNLAPPRLAWSGDFSAEHIEQVLDSPIRKQIAERILDGQSAVWVLLESDDATKNAAALAELQGTLAKMQQTLKLPAKEEIEADEFFEPETKVDLRIEFSIIRIPYNKAGEDTVFASTLRNADAEVAGSKEPMVISVFGRGRSYFALAGKDINAESLEQHCRFLIGDCSCRVKRENPGTDLLFAVAWDDSIKGSSFSEKPLPELTGIGQIGGNQGFPASLQTTSTSAGTDETKNELANSDASDGNRAASDGAKTSEPSLAAEQGTSTTSHALTPFASDTDASSPLTATSLNWIFGLAALTLLVILAGTMWLRSGA